MKLEIKKASFGYSDTILYKNLSFGLTSGELLCVLGPNGVGKTTLFKTILRLLKLKSGEILIDGKNINTFSPKELYKCIAYIPQAHTPPFPFTVIDIVLMGRAVYIKEFSSPSKIDKQIAEESLDLLGISYLKNKAYTEISGGERQLVLIARAITQQASIIIMDEPTSNLDYGNQIKVLTLIKSLCINNYQTILMSCHNPNHALLYGSKVAIMKKEGLFSFGNPSDEITPKVIKETYGIDIKMINANISENSQQNICIPFNSNFK
ncbi:ABC transporter ATP-binding protein [Clostridium botulinum]|uniref:ABC transporter ATP-binding protein n=1 Tax=Clostridium botulinum TaxID=1491 RepID=A0A846J7D3_CLOBO|nr:ABC transporter ATP-binding protein [Clostridium botulinum]ACA54216.1 putative iron chelate uptake ABC transporter, FeCT family, ATP-binding protein [Clostridium botulinum A3 str. Loch Maree]NFH66659.1 ABC transporter ATP-binding protein [Clostridium botulinum]NFJ07763.1 ABC transporter ATP-binding protein [Clostridium botulinum]NFK13447.1 ABC transporter ATP-binding protein [Clostridium botulinum]NFM93425.1 ABC transporter ATP-binding protein [Clostridium botulinum]